MHTDNQLVIIIVIVAIAFAWGSMHTPDSGHSVEHPLSANFSRTGSNVSVQWLSGWDASFVGNVSICINNHTCKEYPKPEYVGAIVDTIPLPNTSFVSFKGFDKAPRVYRVIWEQSI